MLCHIVIRYTYFGFDFVYENKSLYKNPIFFIEVYVWHDQRILVMANKFLGIWDCGR